MQRVSRLVMGECPDILSCVLVELRRIAGNKEKPSQGLPPPHPQPSQVPNQSTPYRRRVLPSCPPAPRPQLAGLRAEAGVFRFQEGPSRWFRTQLGHDVLGSASAGLQRESPMRLVAAVGWSGIFIATNSECVSTRCKRNQRKATGARNAAESHPENQAST